MKATVIHNRMAGAARRKREDFAQAVDVLHRAGWDLDLRVTTHAGHAVEIARQAVSDGVEVVVAAGGDGTVNEVIQALAYTDVALGVLPIGTVNVWSREAGFSKEVPAAARELCSGHRVTLDLGRAGDRYFLLMAGVGFDAEVASALGDGKHKKQKLRVLPYILRTVRVLPKYRGAALEIELDGSLEHHDALMVLASNTRLYGGIGRPNPRAVANDGMLDIRIFRGRTPMHTAGHIARLLLQKPAPENETVRARQITVNAEPPLAVQVDGDPIGMTPVAIAIEPKALSALVPTHYDRKLIDPIHD